MDPAITAAIITGASTAVVAPLVTLFVQRRLAARTTRVRSGQKPLSINITKDHQGELIRFSISALVRIEIDGEHLLVKGNHIKHQYQPVGGVLKRFPGSNDVLSGLGVKDDDKMPINDDTRHDLRVRVPAENVSAFVSWYLEGKGRESSPWREFHEELIETGILNSQDFPYINYQHVRTHVEDAHFTEFFQCYEVLIAEIYEFIPTDSQRDRLKEVKQNKRAFIWADEQLIRTRGVTKERQDRMIAKTAEWLL